MKITISNKLAVIFVNLFKIKLLIWFGGLFLLSLLLTAISGLIDTLPSSVGWAVVFSLPLLYLLYEIVDSNIYASNTCIELKENTIEIYVKNLTQQGNTTLPVSQIESISLSQPLLFRLLGICIITFLQESGVMTVSWGYDYQKGLVFVKEFGEKYKIKISK